MRGLSGLLPEAFLHDQGPHYQAAQTLALSGSAVALSALLGRHGRLTQQGFRSGFKVPCGDGVLFMSKLRVPWQRSWL